MSWTPVKPYKNDIMRPRRQWMTFRSPSRPVSGWKPLAMCLQIARNRPIAIKWHQVSHTSTTAELKLVASSISETLVRPWAFRPARLNESPPHAWPNYFLPLTSYRCTRMIKTFWVKYIIGTSGASVPSVPYGTYEPSAQLLLNLKHRLLANRWHDTLLILRPGSDAGWVLELICPLLHYRPSQTTKCPTVQEQWHWETNPRAEHT